MLIQPIPFSGNIFLKPTPIIHPVIKQHELQHSRSRLCVIFYFFKFRKKTFLNTKTFYCSIELLFCKIRNKKI